MYCRETRSSDEFFDLVTDEIIDDVRVLKQSKKIFNTGVYKDVLTSKVWPKIGHLPFESEEEEIGPIKMVYDGLGDRFRFYHKGGFFGHPLWKEIYDLEDVSAWDKHHIEERLLHFLEEGFDHPRLWDDNDLKKFPHKPEHPNLSYLLHKI